MPGKVAGPVSEIIVTVNDVAPSENRQIRQTIASAFDSHETREETREVRL